MTLSKRGGRPEKNDGEAFGERQRRRARRVKIHTALNGNYSTAPRAHHHKKTGQSESYNCVFMFSEVLQRDSATLSLDS